MAFEQRNNSGALFVNDRKELDKHPDRKGSAMIGGVEYWVSGWLKESNGKKWMSLAFTPKQTREQLREQAEQGLIKLAGGKKAEPEKELHWPAGKGSEGVDLDDEIPF